ncbi:endonuclease/exonuclease/phosphatase [Penicillium argentinense]|uniref:Endonuclease/exonuclease/phosphatase n=1 Tax=Penicillium argentinense TaxID=1131581 RepID=A0A9W9K7D9_9EURO|nr:endonuclease/exonuclease/phosphatase [Penicillium argentinense]KAJ5094907.1 endonuclease/exonuclease/phosphatase [Penicillium argentinense]
MPVKRSERGGNASSDASDPPVPDAAPILSTTRSGLVRQGPVATTTQGIAAEGDNEVGSLPGTTKGPAQQILHYLKPVLRANTELRVANAELAEECKRMSEAYKNVEAIAAEAALYRKELDESRKEVHELYKEVANLKELIQSVSMGPPTTAKLAPPWAQVQLRASALRWVWANTKQHRKNHFQLWTTGQFTRQLDSALPGPHTKILYDSLDREKAAILAQLRTGHARLNGYLHRIGKADSDLCECGIERETVPHFLLRCTRWNEQRRALIEATGPSFGNLSQMLGGKPEIGGDSCVANGRAWKPDIKIVRAAIAFAVETRRLAPEG